jgi:hypothetical protein
MSQERVFEVLKAAALALKDLDRWDIVLNRSLAYFETAVTNEWVWEGDVNGKNEFPFAWMFPKKGLQKRHEQNMTKLQLSLLLEFRAILSIMTGSATVPVKEQQEEEYQDTSNLPPRKRHRDMIPTPKLMMKFSRSKVERTTGAQNKAILV